MTTSCIRSSLPHVMDSDAEEVSALETAFDRCSRGMYRYFAVRAGGDSHLADDWMQQLWLQALRHATDVPPDEVEFWLRGVAKNLVREHWRKQARRPAQVPIADPRLASDLSERLVTEELPVTLLEQREVRDQLLLAVTELSGDEQELIIGHYFHSQSHLVLAKRLGLSERAVEGRLYRARQTLRTALKDLEA